MTLSSSLFSCGHDIDTHPVAAGGGPAGGNTSQSTSQTGGATATSVGGSGFGGTQSTPQVGSTSTGAEQSVGGTSTVGGSNAQGGASAVGGSQTGTGGTSGISLDDVQAIFNDRCVICHDASKVGLPSFPDLPLTEGASRAALVNRQASESCGGTLVVPGDPTQSYLVQKLTTDTPCAGSQMPRPFERGPFVPLTSEQLSTISSWISAGAPP